jgi:hypothetical protein
MTSGSSRLENRDAPDRSRAFSRTLCVVLSQLALSNLGTHQYPYAMESGPGSGFGRWRMLS